jgi:hypothetical protein
MASSMVGALIVSTPQDVALMDARRGVQMFNKVDIPVKCSLGFTFSYLIMSFCKLELMLMLSNSVFMLCYTKMHQTLLVSFNLSIMLQLPIIIQLEYRLMVMGIHPNCFSKAKCLYCHAKNTLYHYYIWHGYLAI